MHDLELYAVDWDNAGRSERVQIIDPGTGAVLDTETLSSFKGGDYLQWAVSGDVEIKVTRLAGPNAVISGLFLDPSTTSASSAVTAATAVRADTTAQGNGIGTDGIQGTAVLPSPPPSPWRRRRPIPSGSKARTARKAPPSTGPA